MIASSLVRPAAGWAFIAVILVGAMSWQPSWWTLGACAVGAMVFLRRWNRSLLLADGLRLEARLLQTRIDELASMQGRFAGNIAHELKTPMSVVLAEAELLLHRVEPATVRGIASRMISELRHVSDLVDSFLELAQPFAVQDDHSHVPVFVSDVVIAAVGRCRALGTKLKVGMVPVLCTPDNGDPSAEVMGDPVLLEVLVENLLRNALRFSPEGGQVELTTHADSHWVRIVVRDHGVGIPHEQQASVFDWFFEQPRPLTKATGSGFGLAIAKRVVDHHGGTITLRDTPCGGCEFEVVLPRWWPPQVIAATELATHTG